MFGSIGGPEVILLFIVALLLFGPRRLPEIGRTLGKAVADFRRATNDFKMNLEREVQLEELKATVRPIENAPRPETFARGLLAEAPPIPEATAAPPEVTPPAAPAAPTNAGEKPAPPEDPSAIDGGTGSIH